MLDATTTYVFLMPSHSQFSWKRYWSRVRRSYNKESAKRVAKESNAIRELNESLAVFLDDDRVEANRSIMEKTNTLKTKSMPSPEYVQGAFLSEINAFYPSEEMIEILPSEPSQRTFNLFIKRISRRTRYHAWLRQQLDQGKISLVSENLSLLAHLLVGGALELNREWQVTFDLCDRLCRLNASFSSYLLHAALRRLENSTLTFQRKMKILCLLWRLLGRKRFSSSIFSLNRIFIFLVQSDYSNKFHHSGLTIGFGLTLWKVLSLSSHKFVVRQICEDYFLECHQFICSMEGNKIPVLFPVDSVRSALNSLAHSLHFSLPVSRPIHVPSLPPAPVVPTPSIPESSPSLALSNRPLLDFHVPIIRWTSQFFASFVLVPFIFPHPLVIQIKKRSASLPTHIWEHIFGFLPVADINQCCLVSRHWNQIVSSNSQWKLSRFVGEGEEREAKSSLQMRQEKISKEPFRTKLPRMRLVFIRV